MITLTITDTDGETEVWVSLQAGDVTRMTESFVIASGETRDEAIERAIQELDEAQNELRRCLQPIGKC